MGSFADLADLPEDDRIKLIGQYVTDNGGRIAVVVDNEPGKADRYIRKITTRFPEVELHHMHAGPVENCTSLTFRRKMRGGG